MVIMILLLILFCKWQTLGHLTMSQLCVIAIQSSKYPTSYSSAVPLTKHEAMFLAMGKRGSEVTRLQFPLTLAWATTIHKYKA